MLEMFLIIKKKEFIITSIISLSIYGEIMIAYTTFLFTIITVEWFGNYVNIFSCLIYIASIIILILFKKNKIFKKENNYGNCKVFLFTNFAKMLNNSDNYL